MKSKITFKKQTGHTRAFKINTDYPDLGNSLGYPVTMNQSRLR